jgi:hypothetical protein
VLRYLLLLLLLQPLSIQLAAVVAIFGHLLLHHLLLQHLLLLSV